MASRASTGSACSTSIRRPSPTTCSRRWRSARRSASTSTSRCSTRRRTCSGGCGGLAIAPPTTSCWRASGPACPASRCARRSSSASRARPSRTSKSSCAFVRDTGFDHVGVFTYSHEEDTRAFAMADDVPAAVKASRRDRLMQLQTADRAEAAVGAPWRRHRSHGRRPVPRLGPRPAGPAGRPGARHRRRGLPVGVRCVGRGPGRPGPAPGSQAAAATTSSPPSRRPSCTIA